MLIQSMPCSCLVLTSDLMICEASDIYLSAMRKARNDILGRNFSEVFPEPASAVFRGSMERARDSRKLETLAIQRFDLPRPEREDGGYEEHYWYTGATPILDESGEVQWLIHRADDVTALIHDRDGVDERLRAEVCHSSRAVQAARDNAARTRADQVMFLARVSHDLRQPIQAIMFLMELLNRQAIPDKLKKPLGLLKLSVDALNTMLDGMLDLSRIEGDMVRPQPAPFRIDRLVTDIVAEFKSLAEEKGLRIEVDCKQIAVMSDRPLVARILQNLMANALKYTETGTIGLYSETENDTVSITVADTGIGIPSDKLALIFNDFYQVGNPARDDMCGLGIGLGTVSRAVRLLGHRITVHSRPGKGSAFTLSLPVSRAAVIVETDVSASSEVESEYSRRLAGHHVLLVEDEAPVAEAIAGLFESWSMIVTAVGSIDELARALPGLDAKPDIMVTDFLLPNGRTGNEAIALVRTRWNIPALILTGDSHCRPAESACCGAEGVRLLYKPITAAELRCALAHEL
ncbi:MAG: ATP-binding protein [Rhodospirillaceae bacterium]